MRLMEMDEKREAIAKHRKGKRKNKNEIEIGVQNTILEEKKRLKDESIKLVEAEAESVHIGIVLKRKMSRPTKKFKTPF